MGDFSYVIYDEETIQEAAENARYTGTFEDYVKGLVGTLSTPGNITYIDRVDHVFSSLSQGGMLVYVHGKNKLPANVFVLNELGQEIDYNMNQIDPNGLRGEITKDSIAIPLSDHNVVAGWRLILLF